MAGLLAYAAAGAAAGFGEGIREQAAANMEAAIAKLKHGYKLAEQQNASDLRRAEKGLPPLRLGGAGAPATAGASGGGGSSTGSRSGGGSRGSAGAPSGSEAASAPAGAGSAIDSMYPLAPEDKAAAPAADPTLPRMARPGEKLVNRFQADDGSWRAFTTGSNEEVLLKPPSGSGGAEPGDTPPFMTKPQQEDPKFGGKPASERESPKAPKDARVPVGVERSDRHPSPKRPPNVEREPEVRPSKAAGPRETVVTNEPGTAVSRALGMDDGVPDETKVRAVTKPQAPAMAPDEVEATLAAARAAIAAGKSRAAVEQRLRDNGIDPGLL